MGSADHETVFIENSTKPSVNKKPPILVNQYKKADWETIKEDMCILRESISEKLDEMNTNELWDELERAIHSSMKKYIQIKASKDHKQRQKLLVLKHSFQKKSYWAYIEDILTDEVNSPYSNEISSTHKFGKRF